jgi:YebC/PmpR family DNA-binding regulatory protein
MSGHSKWHSIRHAKGKADAKRGKVFSKLSKAISVCAREGGPDPVMNFSLRLAIDKAKAANMPKDNIERAISRGQGGGEGQVLQTAVYEGMGPGGAAILVEAVTDNLNRTIANVKIIFNKGGGNMDAKVMWMFDRKGVVRARGVDELESRDTFELALIDAGADNIEFHNNELFVTSAVKHLSSVILAVNNSGLDVQDSGIEYIAKDAAKLSGDDEEKLENFIEALEDEEDVSAVYTNAA